MTYYWPIYLHAARFIIPLVLLVLLFRRPNRTPSAWLALIPVIVVPPLMFWLLEQSDMASVFGFLSDSVAIFLFSVAFLWLLADKLVGTSRTAAFGYAVLILVVAGIIGLISVSALSFGLLLIPVAFIHIVTAGVTVVAIALAGGACRKHYSPVRYLVWLLVFLVLGVGCAAGPVAALMMLSLLSVYGGADLSFMFYFCASVLATGLAVGLVLFLLMLPFSALALWSPMFRPRFHAIFRLPGMDFPQGEEYNDSIVGEREP